MVQNGDVIEIDAGTYTNQQGVWTASDITLRGVGGRAHIVAAATITNEKAIWVTQGSNTRIENIEFSGAAVPDENGAGIRMEGNDIAICGSSFHDNETGILGGSNRVLVEYSEFYDNGIGDGQTHNIYIGQIARFTMRYSYSHHCNEGQLVKTNAEENYILYNRIMDEDDGNSNYQINFSKGGLSFVIGNILQKGPNSGNSGALITSGSEGLTNPRQKMYIINNTMVNDLGSNLVAYIHNQSGSETAVVTNNLLVGNDTVVDGSSTQTTNLQTEAPNLVDRAGFNYRPTVSTPGINSGTAPGIGDSYALTPAYQYLHPANRQDRPSAGTIDIGAYEFQ